MPLKSLVLILALWIGFAVPAGAGYEEGIAAYARGDYMTAWLEWQALGEQGHRQAQYNLGILHTAGLGVPPDRSKAAQWFRSAAKQGLSAAQLRLGAIYRDGHSGPKNPQEAYFWFTLAVANLPPGIERERAISDRDNVSTKLTRAQITQTLERALQWEPAGQQKAASSLMLVAAPDTRTLSTERQGGPSPEARVPARPHATPLEELSFLAAGVRPGEISRR